jgi:S1 RNA binding domain protein
MKPLGGSVFYMALEVGSIVEGQVTGIAKFGAFVELPDKSVGLVHISEVANEYVKDIHDYLKEGDKVKVKILSIDANGKTALSIKQTTPRPASHEGRQGNEHRRDFHTRDGEHHSSYSHNRQGMHMGGHHQNNRSDFRSQRRNDSGSFEDKLSRFLKDSDERLLDLKRNVESKRGGRGARRSV